MVDAVVVPRKNDMEILKQLHPLRQTGVGMRPFMNLKEPQSIFR